MLGEGGVVALAVETPFAEGIAVQMQITSLPDVIIASIHFTTRPGQR